MLTWGSLGESFFGILVASPKSPITAVNFPILSALKEQSYTKSSKNGNQDALETYKNKRTYLWVF